MFIVVPFCSQWYGSWYGGDGDVVNVVVMRRDVMTCEGDIRQAIRC